MDELLEYIYSNVTPIVGSHATVLIRYNEIDRRYTTIFQFSSERTYLIVSKLIQKWKELNELK